MDKNGLEIASAESELLQRVSEIIEQRKYQAQTKVNSEATLMYWEVGHYINSILLGFERADYGKEIISTLSEKLQSQYGKSFSHSNLRRMMHFSERIANKEIVATLSHKLSWSHIIELLPLKTEEARLFYANDVAERSLSVRELRHQISRKAFERREIANSQLTQQSTIPFNTFKDPYLLDFLELKDTHLEKDLEQAILSDLENFILEAGQDFTFVERQKRMIMDNEDYLLDLLFFHRGLRRLVAIELKLGKFKPAYKGQMEFYLRWLNKHARKEWEEQPIGIILCTEGNRDQIELMEMDKAGIAVSEYWTAMPTKAEFERKINEIYEEAKERLARRESLIESEKNWIE